MKKIVGVVAVVAAVSALGLRADDDESLLADIESSLATSGTEEGEETAESTGDESEAEGEESEGTGDPIIDAANALAKEQKEKYFFILPFCRRIVGKAEVLTPGTNEWVQIKEGRYYPLGTIYRTNGAGTTLDVKFGKEVDVHVSGDASFGTRAQALGEMSRTISLIDGTIDVKLPRNLPASNTIFVVTAPGFTADNLAGDSRYTYTKTADGDKAVIRCVTGSMAVKGRHFSIAAMRAANEIALTTSQDLLFTGIYGQRGDIVTRLDQGQVLVKDYATGESHIEDKYLDWKLSPQTAVRIHRALPSIGERMSVTVMTFDSVGDLKNRCAFAEKCYQVNSGELGPTSKKDREEIAKRAAEVEDVAADAGATTEETADDGAASDDSSSGGDDFEF